MQVDAPVVLSGFLFGVKRYPDRVYGFQKIGRGINGFKGVHGSLGETMAFAVGYEFSGSAGGVRGCAAVFFKNNPAIGKPLSDISANHLYGHGGVVESGFNVRMTGQRIKKVSRNQRSRLGHDFTAQVVFDKAKHLHAFGPNIGCGC